MNQTIQYQLNLYKNFIKFNKKPWWNYPIYCEFNDYFEEFFYRNYLIYIIKNKINNLNFIYIPITWTSTLKSFKWENLLESLQPMLNNLDSNYNYFTVCMHDNAPIFKLPQFTKNFSGDYCCDEIAMKCDPIKEFFNKDQRENIAIPLITNSRITNSKIKLKVLNDSKLKNKYLASFVGSNSHEIRNILEMKYKNNSLFYIRNNNNPNMENVSEDDLKFFINKSLESYFVLCPRGFGSTSYRLYEAMQLNRVPVYISDIFWLPYENEINWNDICVFIKPEQINLLEDILNEELKSGNYQKKLKYINEIYDKYFTFEKIFDRIIKNINCGMP